jgi:hypothetical protein
MTQSSCRRSLLAFALGLVMLTPGAFAAGRSGGPTPSWSPWSLLARFFAAFTLDAGCGFDPDGHCLPAAPAADALDPGCGLDPGGRCLSAAPASNLDEGCGLDPSGRCLSAVGAGY